MRPRYKKAIELYDIMCRAIPNDRPSCAKILKQLESKDTWVLYKGDFTVENDLRDLLKSEKFEEKSIAFWILKRKLFL